MRTLLFCWELGANLGHLGPMASIARALGRDGLRVVYAVRDLGYARLALGPDAEVLQAPFWPHHRHFGSAGGLASYADILTSVGFADEAKLAAMVAAWDALLRLLRPDCVVVDHGPALMLALYGRDIPVVGIGTPFTMPPLEFDRFPPLQGDRAPAVPEARLLQMAHRVQGARRAPAPASLQEMLRTPERIVFGLPELDIYQPFRSEPLATPPEGLPKPLPVPEEKRLFAYLGGEMAGLNSLVQALSLLGVRIEAFLRGEVGPLPEFLRLRGATVHDLPPPFAETLRRASHAISHAGANTTAAALAAGRPQLLLPLQAEALTTTELLARMGVGRRLEVEGGTAELRSAIATFLGDESLAENARAAAARIAERSQPDGRALAAEAIRRRLG